MHVFEIPLVTADLEPGTRVGLFASYLRARDGRNILTFYGWGWYEGDFPLDDLTGVRAYQSASEKKDMFDHSQAVCVPRLSLDDGTITWGILTHFLSEHEMIDLINQADIVETKELSPRMTLFNKHRTDLREFSEALEQINNFEEYEA